MHALRTRRYIKYTREFKSESDTKGHKQVHSLSGMGDLAKLHQLVLDLHAALDDEAADVETKVNHIVKLLTDRHALIRSDHDMEIICEDILHHSCIDSVSDEALAELLFIWKGLNMVDAAVGTEEPSDLDHGFSVLSLTYYLGHTFGANVFRKVAQELDTLVIPAVSKCSHHRVHIPAVRLLYEVCLLQELSLSDMDELSDDLIVSTLLCIDKTSSAECLESYNYSLIKLLLAMNDQFMMKNHARQVCDNRIITCLAPRLYLGKSLGANMIFMFNRADNVRVQRLIIRFLYRVLSTPETAELFYTNDLKVMLDVILREARCVADENEELQQGYLNVLPSLLHNPQMKGYKSSDVRQLLTDLRRTDSVGSSPDSPSRGSPTRLGTDAVMSPMCNIMGNSGVRPSTRRVAERVFLECRDVLFD